MLGIEAPVCFSYFLSPILEILYNLVHNLVERGDHINPAALGRPLWVSGDDRCVLVFGDGNRTATIVLSSLHQALTLYFVGINGGFEQSRIFALIHNYYEFMIKANVGAVGKLLSESISI